MKRFIVSIIFAIVAVSGTFVVVPVCIPALAPE